MLSSTLLFSELGSLAHNAALGVAAMCGNSAVAPTNTLSMEPIRDIDSDKSVSTPDPDMLLAVGVDSGVSPSVGAGKTALPSELSRLQQVILKQQGIRTTHVSYGLRSSNERGTMGASAASGASYNPLKQIAAGGDHAIGDGGGAVANVPSSAAPPLTVVATEHVDGVNVAVDLTGEEKSDADTEAASAPRGGLTVTGGYSAIEGISVGGKISRSHIFGPRDDLSASAHYSKVRTSVQLGYKATSFLGAGIAFAPTLFASRLSATGFGDSIVRRAFSQSARGLNVLVNRKFADGLSATANYRISDDSFRLNEQSAFCDASILGSPICREVGDRTNSILSLALTFGEKVRVAGKTHRFRLRLANDLSVGGSGSFTRTQLSGEAHIGLGSRLSLSFEVEGGYMARTGKDEISLFERFYIGDSSMRGFDLRGIGPKIRPTAAQAGQNVAIGGRAYYVARTELSAKTGGAFRLQPSIFVDAGSVFLASKERLLPGETVLGNSSKPRVSVGVGLSLNTPAGKLRFDFVKPLVKQEGDRAKLVSISFGTSI